jgi:hypothetical protein
MLNRRHYAQTSEFLSLQRFFDNFGRVRSHARLHVKCRQTRSYAHIRVTIVKQHIASKLLRPCIRDIASAVATIGQHYHFGPTFAQSRLDLRQIGPNTRWQLDGRSLGLVLLDKSLDHFWLKLINVLQKITGSGKLELPINYVCLLKY